MAKYKPEEKLQAALSYLIPDYFPGQLDFTADEVGECISFDVDREIQVRCNVKSKINGFS